LASQEKSCHMERLSVGDQFFFLIDIFFRQLRVYYSVAPSLTRGRVCNLLLLLVLRQSSHTWSTLSDERSDLSFVSLLSVSVYSQYVRKIFTLSVFNTVQGCI
jgi:hypothetical protein